jgi:repressor LexA
MNVPEVVAALKRELGSQQRLADELRVGQNTVSRWLSGSQDPGGARRDKLRELAVRYGIIDQKAAAADERGATIPIMGYIGAGDEVDPDFEQAPPDGFDQVVVDLDLPPDTVAFEVRGGSMWPRWKAGDLIIVQRRRRDPAALIGEEAAVSVIGEDGYRRYVKKLAAGPRRGSFNLESVNAAAPTIVGARLAWASPVLVTLHRWAYRRRNG